MRRVLIPLPDRDFDVTEVAVPWKLLTQAGHEVDFATETGEKRPAADPRLLAGVLFGQLGAAPAAIDFYRELEQSAAFRRLTPWSELEPGAYDALLLPGGHAPGMRQYLGSRVLQEKVAAFWRLERPVAAICHGVLVLARSRDPRTGKSILAGSRTTCLPGYMERLAYFITGWKLGSYYRTYPAYVEEEVRAALDNPDRQFQRGPLNLTGKLGTAGDDSPAFVVEDGRYVSARFPGDAYLFARRLLERLG